MIRITTVLAALALSLGPSMSTAQATEVPVAPQTYTAAAAGGALA